MAGKCPHCTFRYEGDPQKCPSCGRELRGFDPSRCQFCGSRVNTARDSCQNCGAPFEHFEQVPDQSEPIEPVIISQTTTTTTMTQNSGSARALKVGCVVLAVLILGIAGIIAMFALKDSGVSVDPETGVVSAKQDGGDAITDAMIPDSIYRGVIVEDRNTVESIWSRVLTDLPDSCYYPEPYDPCAAFRFTVEGRRILAKVEASAPIDLVITLLREENGVLTYVGWNEDGISGNQDPMLIAPLDGGTYIALVTNYGGYEYGDVRFIWSVVMPEIPLVTSDSTFFITQSDAAPIAYFELDIERGRTYSIRTEARTQNMDSYIELRTEGGSILSDDDSGRNDFCWGDARLSFTASPLQEGRATVIVRPLTMYSPTYGDLDVVFTMSAP